MFCVTSTANALVVNFRSGNAVPGNPDPQVRYYDLAATCGQGFPGPFGPAEFAAASAGPQAIVMQYPHPNWAAALQCDPQAKWVGRDDYGTPMSDLYAIDFDLGPNCCFDQVNLTFCWTTDDVLGDANNPAGIYINGTPVFSVTGGNYATETVMGVDITSYVHCGVNTLYVHNRDLGCAISGVMFSGTVNARECATPTQPASWGSVKATYR
jgi:hypothetical protein